MIALVPDLDSRFERLYGYLNDDVTRRRATVGLALALADVAPASSAARARLLPGAPLIDRALVQVEDADRPFLTRALRVPDRVTAHLLGDDALDPALVGVLTEPVLASRAVRTQVAERMAARRHAGQRLVYVRESGAGIGAPMAVDGAAGAGRPVLGRRPGPAGARPGSAGGRRGARPGGAAARRRPWSPGRSRRWPTVATEALRRLADLLVPVVLVGSRHLGPELDRRRAAGARCADAHALDRSTVWTT